MRVTALFDRSARYVLFALLCAVLAACGGANRNDVAFDGVVFRAKTSAIDKRVSRADFQTTIRDAGRSLDGAREAARYEGTKYCVENYGTSRIAWAIGPETDPARLSIVDGDITFRGRCDP